MGRRREDAEKIRAQLYAEHEAAKEQLEPFVFPDDDEDGNPRLPDLGAMAHHLNRGKEQAELFHLHGKQDEVTHHEGEAPVADAKAERMRALIEFMHEKGLDVPPMEVIDAKSREVTGDVNGNVTVTGRQGTWAEVLERPRDED